MIRYVALMMAFAVVAGLMLIDNLSSGIGLLFVLVLALSFQIEKQQDDIRKLAAAVTFIALVLTGGRTEEETGE